MQIQKRDGRLISYDPDKIRKAILAAFDSLEQPVSPALAEEAVNHILADIDPAVAAQDASGQPMEVEEIQDLVEQGLIALKQHKVVRHFILYRTRHAEFRLQRARFAQGFPDQQSPVALACLDEIRILQREWDASFYPVDALLHKFVSFQKPGMTEQEALSALTRAALELTSKESPRWEYVASAFLAISMHAEISREWMKRDVSGYPAKVAFRVKEALYGAYITEHYGEDSLLELEAYMDARRDRLLTFSGLDLLSRRYLVRGREGMLLETPQELFMGIAMHLAIPEGEERVLWAKRFYDMLSRLQVTMATPTMSNARKPFHQLSSCFIDVVPDSLDGIYRSITNFSQVSKFGGGMGLYFGKVRAVGSDIRGFRGAAGGVMRWIRLANDTAVAVDQLGVRQGAVAVYLDAWHRDLPEFLQMKTNSGDDRQKAHDVFPAICWPDLFWRLAQSDMEADWHLMCPHEIQQARGYSLEDFWGAEWEQRYWECVADPAITKRTLTVKELVRMVLKSVVETGTPFAFNRDTVNRLNPNAHAGMIYSSNLCTEIAQNMAPIESLSQETVEVDGDAVVVTTTKAGDFVVCNLASLVLGNMDVSDGRDLETVIPSVIRALDNVLELNHYPVPYARVTNHRYRPIGLGTSGYHHLLAREGIRWESPEHLAYADMLYERINRLAIEASCGLAEEKGAYPLFGGSDWQTGSYFEKREYVDEEWMKLRERVGRIGMRNGYLMAVAPTGTTSIIAGTTAAVDPVMDRYFLEEKKGIIVPRVAPDLTPKTFWLYKAAHAMDQAWVVDAAAVRQRHLDQAQSVNLFITPDFTMRQVLALYLRAWEKGMKTVYYVRSQALDPESCDVCSA